MSSPRSWWSDYLWLTAVRRATGSSFGNAQPDGERFERTAVVFAPHPDDETLGCGGTILKKCAAGTRVRIVFMTDGRASHGGLLPPDELARIRADEAIEAATRLGVPAGRTDLLGFPDGRLRRHADAARKLVGSILREERPQEVYVTWQHEPPADHRATRSIVIDAIADAGLGVDVFEYPIWYWYHAPWVRLWQGSLAGSRAVVKNSIRDPLGLRVLREFNTATFVGDVLEKKRTALAAHRTQLDRVIPDERWLTLADVAGGDFLACFFREHELFRSYRIDGSLPSRSAG